MGAKVDHFVAQGGNHGSLLSMDAHAVPRGHVGPVLDDLAFHMGVGLQVVDQPRGRV
jgi:hypothetical protein